MGDLPVEQVDALMHIVDGSPAFAGRYLHEGSHPTHTHSFVEVAVVVGGSGVQHSLAGQQRLTVGDVLLLRPGVWHGYEQCRALDLYNCCFTSELLRRELAWTREDPRIGHLLWTGPYAHQRRGMLTGHVEGTAFGECVEHLERLQSLRGRPVSAYKGDLVGGLTLFLSALARALGPADPGSWASVSHPAVLDGMRLMEAKPAHPWTLTDLATQLHVAPGYLVRLFKAATGLPPMAYLSRHRIELAAARLLHTDSPISAIGESVGWPDPNYFARRFKSHYGLSASAYRALSTKRMRAVEPPTVNP